MVNQPLLAPSLLAGNHAHLGASLQEAEDVVGIKWIHLDIMDGHFVPNLTFGPQTVADLRLDSGLYFDTHLMLANPHDYVEAFASAGSQNITIHVEPDYPIHDTLQKIRDLGCQCGICINPDTPAHALEPFLDKVDLILGMTVQPGFGGQPFREDVLVKFATLEQWRQEGDFKWRLQVDGGVNLETGKRCRSVGVDTFVAGTAFYRAENRAAFAQALTA